MKRTHSLFRFLIIAISIVLCLSLSACKNTDNADHSNTTANNKPTGKEGDFLWEKDNNSMRIIGYSGDEKHLIIPSTIQNIPVVSIGKYAFLNNNTVESIVLPDTITSLDYYAFYCCSELSSVTLSNNITTISVSAFRDCPKLTSIVIPNSVKTIEAAAFYNCLGLTSVVIPDSVTTIDNHAFYNCINLTSVTLGAGIKKIEESAFANDYKLVEVINHSSLTIEKNSNEHGQVAKYAKAVHKDESKIVNFEGYLFFSENETNYLLAYAGNKKTLVLPNHYLHQNYKIYTYAFYGRSDLTSVTIGTQVTEIGELAFAECIKLESIVISENVATIGKDAFSACEELKNVYYTSSSDKWKSISIKSGNKNLTRADRHYNHVI